MELLQTALFPACNNNPNTLTLRVSSTISKPIRLMPPYFMISCITGATPFGWALACVSA